MAAIVEKPYVGQELLDPVGRHLHKRVETAGYTVDIVSSPGTSVAHRHPGIELVFVHRGTAVWWVGDWLRVLVPGDVIVFDARDLHGSRPVDGNYIRTTIHCVPHAIDPQLTRLLSAIPSLPCRITLPESKVPEIFHAICRLRQCQRVESDRGEGKRWIETIVRELGAIGTAPPSRVPHPVLAEVVDYMIKTTGGADTIDELARRFYVSEGHLHYLFQSHFGCSPAKLWRAIKIEKMCSELFYREHSVDELAASSGFGSRRGFQRAFKRVTGMSVESYRARIEAQSS